MSKHTHAMVRLTDLRAMTEFILGWFPGYESAISWSDSTSGSDYDWYCAARRAERGHRFRLRVRRHRPTPATINADLLAALEGVMVAAAHALKVQDDELCWYILRCPTMPVSERCPYCQARAAIVKAKGGSHEG